ncbi:MAG: hypothetical protein IJD78_05655 [Clostridia bacterium]|nr:hypothetical protein [Clostridia bacterium]
MKRILALILAGVLVLGLAACGGNETPEETTIAPETEAFATEAVADATEAATEAATDAAVTEAVSLAEGETAAATEEATAEGTTAAAIAKAPETTEEILALYNKTINDAVAAKVGFNKERYTDNEELNAGFLLKTFGDLIYSFMGIGAENKYTEDVVKGDWAEDLPHQYLRKSTLTAADLTSAKCTEKDGKYTIVLGIKDGTSKASKSESWTKASLDKCGICVGDADKSYFDHKTAPVIYSAVGEVLSSAVISESYSNAKVVAVVDAATGHLVTLTVEFDINVVIDAAGGGNATGSSHVLYKNFKY